MKVKYVEFYHNSDLEIRHLIIKEVKHISFILYRKRDFIYLKDGGKEYRLMHYFYTGWPDYNVIEPKKLLDLIETINRHTEHSFHLYGRKTGIPSGPAVVHCR